MRNFLLTLVGLVAATAMAYGAFYAANSDGPLRHAAREGDALAWLRGEFHLDDRQFAGIKQLNEDYGQVCVRHCQAIMEARRRGAPANEMSQLEETCVQSMTAHFRQVAALMAPGQGERYLATVLPRIADYGHAGSPTVQVRP